MSGEIVTIERGKIDPHPLYGQVVGADYLVLIHQEYDFQFDGFVIVRQRDITSSYGSKANDYGAAIMRKEGLWQAVPRWVKKLPLGSWQALLKCFVGRVVILENERRDTFSIGPVLECQKTGVLMHVFDGCGRFMGKEKVPYRSITCMKFGDRYSTLHGKYLKG